MYGQIGDGTIKSRIEPFLLMTGVKAVSSGGGYTAILKTNGSLWMCGSNVCGKFGNGTLTDSLRPIKIM